MIWWISSRKDLKIWAENCLDVTTEEAEDIASAIWMRNDFPHPVNNTDLSQYLSQLDMDWLMEVKN